MEREQMIRWQGTFEQWKIIKAMVIMNDTSLTEFFRQSIEAAHGETLRKLGYFDAGRVSENDHRAKSA